MLVNTLVSQQNQYLFPLATNLGEQIAAGNLKGAKHILDRCPMLSNIPLSDGTPPLVAAVRHDQYAIAALLLQKGAILSQCDPNGLSALEYATIKKDVKMLRILLPQELIRNFDEIAKMSGNFQFAPITSVEATLSRMAKVQQWGYLDALIIRNENQEQLEKYLDDSKGDVNKTNGGISLLHTAALARNERALQGLIKKGGNLFLKNEDGVSPADLLFYKASERDPLRISEAQLFFSLASLALFIAEEALSSSESLQPIVSAALFWLSISAPFFVSKPVNHSPSSVWGKLNDWTHALAPYSFSSVLSVIPGARPLWDIWRTYAVCKNAFSQIAVAYQNFSYDKLKSVRHGALQLLMAGSTIYQCRESLAGAVQKVNEFQNESKQKALQMERESLNHDRRLFAKEKKQQNLDNENHAKYLNSFQHLLEKRERELNQKEDLHQVAIQQHQHNVNLQNEGLKQRSWELDQLARKTETRAALVASQEKSLKWREAQLNTQDLWHRWVPLISIGSILPLAWLSMHCFTKLENPSTAPRLRQESDGVARAVPEIN